MRAIAIFGGSVIALALVTFLFSVLPTKASVEYGGEYNAVQYTSSNIGTSSIKSMAGTIGSVVVSSTSPVTTLGPVIAFYDTSSTTVSTSTLTAKFSFGAVGAVTPPAGTYTFDVAFGQGVYVWVDPSFRGSYTIVYR